MFPRTPAGIPYLPMRLDLLTDALGQQASVPSVLDAAIALAVSHGLYAFDVAANGDCATLAVCASLGILAQDGWPSGAWSVILDPL